MDMDRNVVGGTGIIDAAATGGKVWCSSNRVMEEFRIPGRRILKSSGIPTIAKKCKVPPLGEGPRF